MGTVGIKLSKSDKQRIKSDIARPLRVIENLDFSRVYEDVPVEVVEGYTVVDADTYECFAVFKIQNTGDKEISALDVRLLLYESTANIPTKRLDFTYKAEHNFFGRRVCKNQEKQTWLQKIGIVDKKYPPFVRQGEFFGEGVLIPLPNSYSRKIEFEIRTVHFNDGTSVVVNVVSGKQYKFFKELDENVRYAYSKINVFARAEEKHPIKIIPQSTDRVWLCCCGRKNLSAEEVCNNCGREKEWQLKNITEKSLQNELQNIRSVADPQFIHMKKAQVGKQLTIESEDERRKKAEAFELSLKKVAEQEKIKEHKKRMIVPWILLWIAVVYLFIFLFQSFITYQM